METEFLFRIAQSCYVCNQAIKYIMKVEGMAEWRRALTKNLEFGENKTVKGKIKEEL